MNDDQLYGFFSIEYEEDGITPKFTNPFAEATMGITPEGVYKAYLWRIGIVDKVKQAELWKAERKRRAGRSTTNGEVGKVADGGFRVAPTDLD